MNGTNDTLPRINLEVNGSLLPSAIALSLSAVYVQQRLALPAQIELTFTDVGEYPSVPQNFAVGSTLRVNVERFTEPLFSGDITALEWRYGAGRRRELVVRGYDPLHRMGQRQSVRAFADLTPSGLARLLCGRIGLDVAAPAPGPRREHFFQHCQSDLALLQDVAGRCGLYPTVRGNTLHLVCLAGDGNNDLPLRLGENLSEARVELNAHAVCTGVNIAGWDPQRAAVIEARAHLTTLKDLVPGQVVLGSGDKHSSIHTLFNEAIDNDSQAMAMAQAELDRRQAAQVVFRGLAAGDPGLQPGRSVRVEGLEAHLNGRYVLTEVTHSIDARQGFVSALSTQPPRPPERSHSAAATLGIVTQVEDPEQCGRVRVTLPAYGDVESGWIGVLGIAAGSSKGLVALPDVGDPVLVLLVHEDPGQSLVLGGLYGGERLVDSGVENGAVHRFSLRTADGQLIQLDDYSLRLENRAGSFVELSPDRLHISSKTPLTIEAPGNSVLIRASQIDFEQG